LGIEAVENEPTVGAGRQNDTLPMNKTVLRHRPHRGLIAFLIALLAFSPVLSATEHYGQVGFMGVAVPGATVTATECDTEFVTSTDQIGVFNFPDLADGTWTI
jgi:hypothetical protein